MTNLEACINENIDKEKDDIYYNESFCNLVLDYLGSMGSFSDNDILFLNDNGYNVEDFIGEE